MLDIKKCASIITMVVGALAITDSLIKGCYWICQKFYQWLARPTIIWGFLDCPTSDNAHYYVYSKMRPLTELKVQIKLKPKILQVNDYHITVQRFENRIGCEGVIKVQFEEKIEGEDKTIEFKLVPNEWYRIIVHADGGIARTWLPQNYELTLECLVASVVYRQVKIG